jgi:hypothetical protein
VIDFISQLGVLAFALCALLACLLLMGPRGDGSPRLRNRLGLLGDIDERMGRALLEYVGARFIGGVRASLDFASINAGLQERLTMTVTGALLGDFVQVAPETDLTAGLEVTAWVSAADTVTVCLSNNTAGALDQAATVFRARVTREAKR